MNTQKTSDATGDDDRLQEIARGKACASVALSASETAE